MTRLRASLARLLVGNFVALPSRKGVWVIQQFDNPAWKVVVEADLFRMKMTTDLPSLAAGAPLRRGTRGRFVGTIRP